MHSHVLDPCNSVEDHHNHTHTVGLAWPLDGVEWFFWCKMRFLPRIHSFRHLLKIEKERVVDGSLAVEADGSHFALL